MADIDYSDWAAQGDEDASFDKAPFDHEGGRKKLIERITRTLKQLNGEKVSPQGGKDFETLHNNGVRYKPTLNGHAIQLPGLPAEGVRISRSALSNKLTAFSRDVESGHFDDQLERILSQAKVAPTKRSASASTGKKAGSGKKYPEDHPANTDPDWSTYTQSEKITKASAYRKARKA